MIPDSSLFSLRYHLSAWSKDIARLAFGATIVIMPLRWHEVLVSRPIEPIYKDFTDFLLFASDLTIFVVLIFWLLSLGLQFRRVHPGPRFIWMPLLGICFLSLITSFRSLDIALSIYHTLRLLILFLFYLYIINEVRSLYLIGISISIQVVFQSLITLMQFFLQHSIGMQYWGEHELDPNVYGVSVVSVGLTRILRPYGLTEHPNILGGCLAFSLILLFAAYLYGDRNIRRGIVLIFALGLPALIVTFSRSAWSAFLLGIVMLLGMSITQREWHKAKAVLWLGLVSTLVLTPFIWHYSSYIGARLNVGNSFQRNADENRSIKQRLNLDEIGLRIFLQNPLSGSGLGASAVAINQYHVSNPVPPHFVLLAVAMETGIFGLIFYLLLLCLPFIALLKRKKHRTANTLLTTLSVLLIAITLVGFFDIYPWLLQPGRIWQWLAWGLWAVAYETTDKDLKSVYAPVQ